MSDKQISYGRQSINDDDIKAVIEVLNSNWLTQGPKVVEFESALSKKFGAKYATVVSSGTASLHLIALAMGWKPEDIIITTPITFVASANSIVYAGALPDFVDIDPVNYTLDPNKLEDKIIYHREHKRKVKAVIAVDYAGNICDWKALRYLANKYNFVLINDNCHALGAEYYGDISYAAKYADIVNMSFHPVKHITTGEGGATLTNNKELDEQIKLLRTHGITKDPVLLKQNDGPWYYEMQQLGYNYRMTDIQSALGISQLKRLESFIARRRQIAHKYDLAFNNEARLTVPASQAGAKHVYHLYPLQIDFSDISISKRELFAKMAQRNIYLQVHYIPVHIQPYYREQFGFFDDEYPISLEFYKREVSIPIYPDLADRDVDNVIDELKQLISRVR